MQTFCNLLDFYSLNSSSDEGEDDVDDAPMDEDTVQSKYKLTNADQNF